MKITAFLDILVLKRVMRGKRSGISDFSENNVSFICIFFIMENK